MSVHPPCCNTTRTSWRRDSVCCLVIVGFVLVLAAKQALAFTLQSARRGWTDHTQITLTFSEAVDPVTGLDPSRYAVDGAAVQSAQYGTNNASVVLRTAPIDQGPSPTLRLHGVRNASLTQTLVNVPAPVSIVALVPAEIGTPVNGFQDDFDSLTRDPRWLPIGPDVYFQSAGLLNVSAGGSDPNHLLFADPSYQGVGEEILARVRFSNASTHDGAYLGLAVGVPTNSLSQTIRGGMNLLLLNANAYGGPPSRHARLLNDYVAFGNPISFPWQANTWYWLRLAQAPDSGAGQPDVFAKLWLADGDTPEPANWQASWDYYPGYPSARTGYAGFRAGVLNPANTVADYQVDYVLIKASGLPLITPAPSAYADNPSAFQITIAELGNTVGVSWPASAGFTQLQQSPDMRTWSPVLFPIGSNQGRFSTAIPVTNLLSFFRGAPAPQIPAPPASFAFAVGGQPWTTISNSWPSAEIVTALDSNRTQRLRTYTQPGGPLTIQIQSLDYSDFPAREWLLWFQNNAPVTPGIAFNFSINHTGLAGAANTVTFSEHTYRLPSSGYPARQIVSEYADRGIFFDSAAPAYWTSGNSGNVSGGQLLNWQPFGSGFTQPSFPIHFTQPVTNAAFAMFVEGGATNATFDLIRNGIVLASTNAPVSAVNTSNIYVFSSASSGFDAIRITPNLQPAYIHLDLVQHSINQGASISVDFNGYSPGSDPMPATFAGGGPGGARISGGSNWNGILLPSGSQNTPAPVSGLVAGDGTLSPVTVQISNFAGADFYNTDNYGSQALFDDYIVQTSTAGPGTITLGGLVAGATYELYLFADNDGGGAGAVITVNGSPAKTATAGPGTPFSEGRDFLHFTTQADGSGQISILVTGEVDVGGGTMLSVINGFQLTGPSLPAPFSDNVNTPLISNAWPGQLTLSRPATGEFILHYADGSTAVATDFQPHTAILGPGIQMDFAPYGGRSSDGVLPYFNIETPDGTGLIVAVGWTGQWKVSFIRDAGTNLTLRVGMEDFNLSLQPGERIRTPAVLTLSYRGLWMMGQNAFRRLMLAHYSPRPNGLPPVMPVAASGATLGFNNVNETNQVQAINNIAASDLPVNTYWIDAGWSGDGAWPTGMGTWTPDPTRFPNGLRPVGQRAHQAGLRFLLWFEPERVMPNTWLRNNHPEWLLVPSRMPADVAYQQNDGWRLLNFGNPQALNWAKTNFSASISNWLIDIYRHDCNLHPLWYWRTGEASDRKGMNEIRYVMGLYDYFDTLQANSPGLLMDNCASGGRRFDFEMMRRTVPLLRSDYLWDPVGAQSMEYALSLWLPLHGQGGVSTANYDFRSGMGSCVTYAFDFYTANSGFWPPLIQEVASYLPLQPLFAGDFYPLTGYSTNATAWIAWQFDRPDLQRGLVQAFRRSANLTVSLGLVLSGLDPAAQYQIRNVETGVLSTGSGSQLMRDGITVLLPPLAASTFYYQRLSP